jgi:uncharacterized protein (TIGR03083 family)
MPPADPVITIVATSRSYHLSTMDALVERHIRACDAFARVADSVPHSMWTAPTPCPEWDARAIVEHVIGFHEVLILRPLGVRAHRPREGEPERWRATMNALAGVLEPNELLGALTTDVVVHTWDLARATSIEAAVDEDLCATSYEAARRANFARGEGIGPAIDAPADADVLTQLVAFYGRDPSWTPPSTT